MCVLQLNVSWEDRVQLAIKQTTAEAMTSNEIRALSILIFIISLLGAHCNLDQLRHDNPGLFLCLPKNSTLLLNDHFSRCS
jgi:cohesin loading factor subunit SCC2